MDHEVACWMTSFKVQPQVGEGCSNATILQSSRSPCCGPDRLRMHAVRRQVDQPSCPCRLNGVAATLEGTIGGASNNHTAALPQGKKRIRVSPYINWIQFRIQLMHREILYALPQPPSTRI